MKRWQKTGIAAVVCLVAFATVTGTVDCWRALAFEKPIFARPADMADDGGSGIYIGLGYSVEIRGWFLSADENPPGITDTEFQVLGIRIAGTKRIGVECAES